MLFAGTELFDVLKNGNSACLFGIMLHVKQTYLIVEYCKKEIISDKKHSARTERSINIGKKNYTSV